jgi:hypothetical protein
MSMEAPEKGYYYHFKHNPSGPVNTYAYEVLGVGRHSEDGTHLIVYRPLYTSDYFDESDFSLRPLAMFMENVTKDGKTFPRFTKITDESVIAQLKALRGQKNV